MAASALRASSISTDAKPRARPVSRSVMMFTDAISVLLILLLVPARLDGLALTIVFPQLALWLPGRLGYL